MSLRRNSTLVTTLLDLRTRSCEFAVTGDGLVVRGLITKETASSCIKLTHMAVKKAESCLALGILITCKLSSLFIIMYMYF